MKIGEEVEITDGYLKGKKVIIKDLKEDSIGRIPVVHKRDTWKVSLKYLKPLSPAPFTLKDLKDGDIVTTREGTEYVVFKGKLLDESLGYVSIRNYYDNLTYGGEDVFDIMSVTRNGAVIWKREETAKVDYEIDYFDKRENKHLNRYFKGSNSQNQLLAFLVTNQNYIEITQIHRIENK